MEREKGGEGRKKESRERERRKCSGRERNNFLISDFFKDPTFSDGL